MTLEKPPRSWWTPAALLLVLVLLAGAYYFPWWAFKSDTGRQTGPSPPGDQNQTAGNVTRYAFGPYQFTGNENATLEARSARHTELLGVLWATAVGLQTLNLLAELVLGRWDGMRWIGMGLAVLSIGAIAVALWWTWFELPSVLAPDGVHSTFTAEHTGKLYIRTNLEKGWVSAGLALLGNLAYIGFRFAAGSFDMSFLERARRERAQQRQKG